MQTTTSDDQTTSLADRADAAAHWPALDGLRGLAVAAVVAYHLGWISGGFLGVDLFFALSGFLITSVLIRESTRAGRIDLREFWARRCRRLLPAVAVMVAVVLVVLAVWGSAAEQATARGDARWALPYLANWHLIAGARDYWASATTLSVFNHLWSLSIEEQFYLCWPVVAWLALRRRGERALAGVAVAGALASFVAMVLLARGAAPSRVYVGTDTRALALLLGAAAATAPVQRLVAAWRDRAARSLDAATLAAATILGVSWIWGGHWLGFLLHGGLAVHSLVASMLVALLAVAPPAAGRWALRSRPATWCSARPLVWLGRRSYGIYLWHWPVIQLVEPRWQAVPAAVRDAFELAVTLLVAEASYRLVEHPIRRRAGWAVGRRAAAATTAGLLVATIVAVMAPSGRGHVATFQLAVPPVASAAAATTTPAPGVVAAPVTETAPAPAPSVAALVLVGDAARVAGLRQPDITEPPAAAVPAPAIPAAPAAPRVLHRVLWIGDSVAADLAPALGAALGAAGLELVDGAFDGARLVPSDHLEPEQIYPGVVSDAGTVDAVVVELSYWDSPASLDDLRLHLGWFRDLVLGTGADLVIVTPPPVRADLIDPGLQRQLQVAGELVAAAPDRVHLVDSAPVWGSEMRADIDCDGAPDRKPDGVHVCPQGAARFAAWAVDALDAYYDGISPAFPSAWVGGDWTSSRRYDTPVGACAALAPGAGG